MLRLKDFVAEGIGPETLARLIREDAVVRPARGLYQLRDTQVDTSHVLAEAAMLVPKGIVCLTSAHTETLFPADMYFVTPRRQHRTHSFMKG